MNKHDFSEKGWGGQAITILSPQQKLWLGNCGGSQIQYKKHWVTQRDLGREIRENIEWDERGHIAEGLRCV